MLTMRKAKNSCSATIANTTNNNQRFSASICAVRGIE
jgi:hypothetical protein